MPTINFIEGPLQGQKFKLPDRSVHIGRSEENGTKRERAEVHP